MSFDIDAFDPSLAPATGTPVNGGLTYREGIYIAEEIHNTGSDQRAGRGLDAVWFFYSRVFVFHLKTSLCPGLLSAMDLVEVNPSLGANPEATEATASLAVDVIASSLGQSREGAHSTIHEIPAGKDDTEQLRL